MSRKFRAVVMLRYSEASGFTLRRRPDASEYLSMTVVAHFVRDSKKCALDVDKWMIDFAK